MDSILLRNLGIFCMCKDMIWRRKEEEVRVGQKRLQTPCSSGLRKEQLCSEHQLAKLRCSHNAKIKKD